MDFGPNPARRQEAFTLIEIILVVLILGVVVGMAVPNFSRTYSTFQLKQFTEDLVYLMRYAQSRAITNNREIRLEFDPEFLQYWLTQQKEGEERGAGDPVFERFTGRYGRIFKVPPELRIKTGMNTVSFYPDGTIARARMDVCRDEKCLTISTKEQRGFVQVLEENSVEN